MAGMAADAPACGRSPLGVATVRRFIVFRVCFNARFYYPVFTVLFLDFGLSLEQFALLNTVWAATIVLLEVPSGALADVIGRRRLVVGAAALMVVEIALLCVVPAGSGMVLLAVFLVNRILSGAAEAAASGADEALAYDSLKQAGLASCWDRVLAAQMRWQSLAHVIAMVLGAALYDPALMGRLAAAVGLSLPGGRALTMRLPLWLTLAMALGALWAAVGMREVEPAPRPVVRRAHLLAEAWRVTLAAGGWIWRSPWALGTIAAGMLFDHIVRMLLTLNSQYLRVIAIPEAAFGLVGAAMSLLGVLLPRMMAGLAARPSPVPALLTAGGLTLAGLWGMTRCWPGFGVLPMLMLFAVMLLSSIGVSHHLNRVTASHMRATVLSFKGVVYNLAYGGIGLLYAGLLAGMKSGLAAGAQTDNLFRMALRWFPGYFATLALGLTLWLAWRARRTGRPAQGPG
jgi:MFS family permease